MIINQQSLLDLSPIKDMESGKKVFEGRTFGLAEIGYDIRLKQKIVFKRFGAWLGDQCVPSIMIDEEEKIGNFCLASAIEEFQMPNCLSGVVHDKSTNIRQGIQVFNTVIEPGWCGFLTLELAFHGMEDIVLEAGTPIAQVVFHEIKHPVAYKGKFQHQPDKPVSAIFEE